MDVESIGVAGAGAMGAGIAQLACLGGFATYLHDPDPEALADGELRVRADLLRGADRGRWRRAEAEAASARLRTIRDLTSLARCELVVEAAPEDLGLKQELFAQLDRICGDDAILATNTSSLRVSAIAGATERPDRVCGMHFFNPPALMELVELVAGAESAERTLDIAEQVARRLGRTPIRAADGVGFIANRCARPFTLEALRLVGERIAAPGLVDRIVRLGGGYRMGPFEVMDLVGVDVNLEVARSFYEQSHGVARWEPHPLQRRLVADGRLGRKSGRGFYSYEDGPHRPEDPEAPDSDGPTALPPAAPAPIVETAAGATAYPCEAEALASVAGGEDAAGYVALPTLAEARLVELTRGPGTSDELATEIDSHFRRLGKHTQWVADAPGLVLGRILGQLVNEACFAVSEAVGTPDDVDTALRLGFNHPRGPFEWAEAIGPERVLSILDGLAGQLGDDRYGAAPFLRRWASEAAG